MTTLAPKPGFHCEKSGRRFQAILKDAKVLLEKQ
jgi:hypothetical protein